MFADYPHKFGPHTFTEPQMFAGLCLHKHSWTSERGFEALLAD